MKPAPDQQTRLWALRMALGDVAEAQRVLDFVLGAADMDGQIIRQDLVGICTPQVTTTSEWLERLSFVEASGA